jgi:hypothetical protein
MTMAALLGGLASGWAQFNVTVDPSTLTNGYANVFQLDGTTFAFGQSWGVQDLTGIVSGGTAQFGAMQVNNGDDFWIVNGTGGVGNTPAPGSAYTANKISEASWYAEIADGSFAGQSLTYSVNVTSFDLSSAYSAFVVIKESANGYTPVVTPVTGTGNFSVTVPQISTAAGNAVQLGLMLKGPTVVPGDQFRNGSFTVTAVPEPSTVALLGGLGALIFVAVRRYRGARA